jgi:septum formation protein
MIKNDPLKEHSKLVLASASPRRKELLALLGVEFSVCAANIDETLMLNETAEAFVERLALEKAQVGLEKNPNCTVLGSDTVIVFNGEVLGKPRNELHAHAMIKSLQGQTHQVLTSVALINSDKQSVMINRSSVRFMPLNDDEISTYVATKEGLDKAGGYGIQGFGAGFIKEINGSYHGIMGLPLSDVRLMLKSFDVKIWNF